MALSLAFAKVPISDAQAAQRIKDNDEDYPMDQLAVE
jgi:hypothetical protein